MNKNSVLMSMPATHPTPQTSLSNCGISKNGIGDFKEKLSKFIEYSCVDVADHSRYFCVKSVSCNSRYFSVNLTDISEYFRVKLGDTSEFRRVKSAYSSEYFGSRKIRLTQFD